MNAASNSEFAIDVQRHEQALRGKARREGCVHAGTAGRDLRISGTEWQRQDHDHSHDVRLAEAGLGSGTCLGDHIVRESAEIKRNVGYMTQGFSFWDDLTIRENLDFVARMYQVTDRRNVVRQSLQDLGLVRPCHASWQVNCRADGSSGWHWRRVCCIAPRCFCWMSRLRVSIPRRDATSGDELQGPGGAWDFSSGQHALHG